jgi:carbon-monoxide dehydrogenase small subunit
VNYEELTLKVNGTVRTAPMPPGIRLLDALRRLGYTGVKEGCGEGECGACTVLLAGRPVNSCLVYAKQAQGKDIVTIEGLGRGHPDGLHPVQKALLETAGVQCGFCTPGIALTAAHLYETRPGADEQEVREALSGNLCRCTGYGRIFEAVKVAVSGRK